MKTVNTKNEEYYEDRKSKCCNDAIYFSTDICVVCENHCEHSITKVTIDFSKDNLLMLEDLLIGQFEMWNQENDEFSIKYCKQINKILNEIQNQT
tara:strand:+ start:320 stop:604 length:285 start_codon:yes stop_codon:yes gene_type:complete